MEEFIITKHIARHGKDSVIVVPTALRSRIPAGSLAQITIKLIETPNAIDILRNTPKEVAP